MDITSALRAYDAVMDEAREAGREPTTADRIYAMRQAIEAYDLETRQRVARALDLAVGHRTSYAWSYLLGIMEECAKDADNG